MGIKILSSLINDVFPQNTPTDNGLKYYSGKTIALDASQYLYQAMAPRKARNREYTADDPSPLIYTFNSVIKLLENGIKPVYVFDGTPPKLKAPVIKERKEKREVAMKEFKVAESKGDVNTMERTKHKVIKLTKPKLKNFKGLLRLMGIPYFVAPGEAEAQCAAFVEAGWVYAAATQDMDALTYGTKVVLRHLPLIHSGTTFPIQELHLEKVLERLSITREQLIDLSILLGCDYCKGVKGLGAHRAVELLHKYHNIETVLENLDRSIYSIPDQWLFKEARAVFLNPKVASLKNVMTFRWRRPFEESIVEYLTGEKQFNEESIRNQLQKVFALDYVNY